MQFRRMVVTGDYLFLQRYQPLFHALSLHCDHLELLVSHQSSLQWLKQVAKRLNQKLGLLPSRQVGQFQKQPQMFINRSRQLQRKILNLTDPPEFVLHLLGMYCPFWDPCPIPYGMYLDYTMMLAHRQWPTWAPFADAAALTAWQDCERLAYQRATHLFAMSQLVKNSLVQDYEVEPEKITVVGFFANHPATNTGEKPFLGQQILFNGSDFERKGGDLVLAAFQHIKQTLPEARLVVIGQKLDIQQDGVENPGQIHSEAMQQLFLDSDLVLAPGRCDPFPAFLIEAMSYGIPCVVSNHDGMPEIVDHGRSGVVVDPLTPEAIAHAVINLLNNPAARSRISERARNKVNTQLNCHQVAQKMMDAMDSIAISRKILC